MHFLLHLRNTCHHYLAPKSWQLRKQVLRGVEGDFFSYTGDKAEGYMLKIYRLKPHVGKRRALSAASVKEKLYDAALGKETSWKEDVPESIAKDNRRKLGDSKEICKFRGCNNQSSRNEIS